MTGVFTSAGKRREVPPSVYILHHLPVLVLVLILIAARGIELGIVLSIALILTFESHHEWHLGCFNLAGLRCPTDDGDAHGEFQCARQFEDLPLPDDNKVEGEEAWRQRTLPLASALISRSQLGFIFQHLLQSKTEGQPTVVSNLAPLLPGIIRGIQADKSWFAHIQDNSARLPNGFIRLKLLEVDGFVLRLHHFNQKQSVDGLHSHKWAFQSAILLGELRSENWGLCREEESEKTTAKFTRTRIDRHTSRIQQIEERVYLRLEEHLVHKAGEAYFFDDKQIHRVMTSNVPTATLVLAHPESAPAYLYDQPEEHAEDGEQVVPTLLAEELDHFFMMIMKSHHWRKADSTGPPRSIQDVLKSTSMRSSTF